MPNCMRCGCELTSANYQSSDWGWMLMCKSCVDAYAKELKKQKKKEKQAKKAKSLH